MGRERVWLAVFLAAAAIAGARVVTDRPKPEKTVRVEVPLQPIEGPSAWLTDPTASTAPLSIDELMRKVTDNLAVRPLCDAPPVELTEEQKQALERTLSTVPIPPTVPADTPGAVSNVHRRLVPC
jgi:hypothetical protein